MGARAPVASITALFASSDKSRLLNQVEKYSSLYYPERVRNVVADALLEYGDQPTRSQQLNTIKRVTLEIWEAEDMETRDIVFEAMAADKAKKEASQVQEGNNERTPLQYQRYVMCFQCQMECKLTTIYYSAISTLPPLLKQVFDELAKTTGWAFTVLMGGPSPEADGNIVSAR